MLGYVVGLGDRHSSNILLDVNTAEVIHIDLGVAFEQGKLLPCPEMVHRNTFLYSLTHHLQIPFRLTRDIQDGMVCGQTEGVFQRCAEETLRVMKEQQSLLLTLVEVFIHDPLYRWSLSPQKVLQMQQQARSGAASSSTSRPGEDSTPNRNQEAQRAILRIKEKLQGVEQGQVFSLEGQVRLLIQQATDPMDLSKLFGGWAAWL